MSAAGPEIAPGRYVYRFLAPVSAGFVLPLPGALLSWYHAEATRHPDTDEPVIELWALVDTATGPQKRVVQVVGTGEPVPDVLGAHIATVIHRDLPGGRGVWHVHDLPRDAAPR